MKSYINIFCYLLFTSVLASCSADGNSASVPAYEQYGSAFTNMPAKEDAVIYQVNIRSFSETGDLNGVREKLGYLQELGVNVIYLMPVYTVGEERSAGGLGSPYSVKDYKAVSPDFGSIDSLRALVAEAHEKNMAVILDWVANHTSWDNSWIATHPDWYQHDANGDIIIPPNTNWNDVAQLDFENKEMRTAMIDAMSYWVYTANIDGFRCDAADFVPQSFWNEAISSLRKIKDQKLLMLAEGSRPSHFDAGFDYTFGFRFFEGLKTVFGENQSATKLQDASSVEYNGIYYEDRRIVRYTSNHDVNWSAGTPIELFKGKPGSIAAFVVASTMKSVPMVYNGQEIGYNNRIDFFYDVPIDWNSADAGMLAEYKKIIAFRKSSEAVKKGIYTGYSNDAISAFTMDYNGSKVLVLANLTNTDANYIPAPGLSSVAWKDAFTDTGFSLSTTIELQPFQYIILKN